MADIPVGSGRVALVDDEDWWVVRQLRWRVCRAGYARRSVRDEAGVRSEYLHRVVADRMGLAGRVRIRNGDRLDCRRSNLSAV
jgi:hypothetical protein